MRRFRTPNAVPPGGVYYYECEKTGVTLSAHTRSGLKDRVVRHLMQSKIDIPTDLDAVIEDSTCRQVPEGFCSGEGPTRPVLTLDSIKETSLGLVNHIKQVPRSLATQRAGVCMECPEHNRQLCTSCVGLDTWALRHMLGGSVGNLIDKALGICSCDGTSLLIGINYETVPGKRFSEYPGSCWRMKHG